MMHIRNVTDTATATDGRTGLRIRTASYELVGHAVRVVAEWSAIMSPTNYVANIVSVTVTRKCHIVCCENVKIQVPTGLIN